MRAALEAARTPGGWDQARVARVVADEFGFLGPFTEARVVDAAALAGAERAAAALAHAARDAHVSSPGAPPADPEAGDLPGRDAPGSDVPDGDLPDGEVLVLGFRPPEGRDLVAAERTFARATAQAERGEGKAALRAFAALAAEWPEVAKYHRAIGQSALVAGDLGAAEDELLRALRLEPADPAALTLLGNLYQKRGRPADAIPLYERSAAVSRNVYALTNLGAALAETEQPARALAVFREAVAEDPSHPNAWFGLGLTITRLQDLSLVREAVDALDRALAAAGERRRAPEVWDNARGLLNSLAVIEAKEEAPAAAALVRTALVEHETAAGRNGRLPVRLEEAPAEAIGGNMAKIELGWVHHRPYHRLVVATGHRADARSGGGTAARAGYAGAAPAMPSPPGPEREHLILHELEHLALATAARDAGTNRWFASTPESRAKAVRATAGDVKRIAKLGYPERAVTDLVLSGVHGLLGQLFNFPLDLLIETRLLARHPEIRELLFFSVRRQLELGARIAENAEIRRVTPGVVWRANTAMNGAMALWLEERFPRRTELTVRYQKASADAWTVAKRLYAAWTADAAAWAPGAEYAWVDRWASMLGLQGWYLWQDGNPDDGTSEDGNPGADAGADPDPVGEGERGAVLGTAPTGTAATAVRGDGTDTPDAGTDAPASGLSAAEEGAATFYLLGALAWVDRVDAAQVRRAAAEAARAGQSGIRLHDRDARYTLPAYGVEPLTGLQAVCVGYVCWKHLDPAADPGIDLAGPYRTAEALHAARRGRASGDNPGGGFPGDAPPEEPSAGEPPPDAGD